jgi:dienelactone hydrolase
MLLINPCTIVYADAMTPRVLTSLFFAALVAVAPAWSQDYSIPGPYPASTRTVTVTRANATTFNARLSYPAAAAGPSQPFSPVAPPAPIISFGHGFLQTTGSYASTLDHLATWGFIVIASDSEGGFAPNHQNFANDLRICVTWLEQQHASSSSFLFGKVDARRVGLSGHSMGAGASILAGASGDTRIDAVANLAAANTNPSSIAASSSVRVPLSLISGGSDTIVPVASNGQQMYAQTGASLPAQLPIITGGFHCGFQDSSFPIGCDSSSLPRATQLALTRRLLTEFFLYHLSRDASVRRELVPRVWGPLSVIPGVTTTRKPCALDDALATDDLYDWFATPTDLTCDAAATEADAQSLTTLLREHERDQLMRL